MTYVSLAEIHLEMSELFDKQVNAQKEKNLGLHLSSCKRLIKVKQRKMLHT